MQVITTQKALPPIGSACDPRSPGPHISEIINDIAHRLGYINDVDWELMTTWGVGLLFEIALALSLGDDLAPRLGELEVDGVYLTPDGYNPLTGRLHEYKVTWKSVNNNRVEFNWMYMAQGKAYCKAVGTNSVLYHILYLMGDYRGSGPLYYEVEITFTDLEIEENWATLMRHKDLMEKEGYVWGS